MKLFPIIFSIFIATSCHAQQSQTLNIIPAPVKAEVKEGKFTITPSTTIVLAASNGENSASFLNHYLKIGYGFELKTTKGKIVWNNAIVLNFDRLNNSIPGAYEMTVDKDKIYIGGNDEQGVFYGIQTLL